LNEDHCPQSAGARSKRRRLLPPSALPRKYKIHATGLRTAFRVVCWRSKSEPNVRFVEASGETTRRDRHRGGAKAIVFV
jgi:hypothetical protein